MRMPGRIWRLQAAMVLALLLLVSGCVPALPGFTTPAPTPTPTPTPAPDTETKDDVYIPAPVSGADELRSVADVVAKVKPSVVAISTEITTYDVFNRPWTQQTAGSGWIIREDGCIVTNSHVVEDATSVMVLLDDGREFEAETIRKDERTDIAVLKIPADNLPVAEIGDSSRLRIGDPLVAIGNSLGMGISATAGIASAVGVSLGASSGQTMLDLIQTDAAINPGNSGGPLVNAAGQVVGINSIKIAQVGVEGMGYAISINQAMPVIEELIEHGAVIRAWLGVWMYSVSPAIAARYDLHVDYGVLITDIVAGSPAERAGLEPGDVIVEFGTVEIRDTHHFTYAIHGLNIGDHVEIVFWRGEERSTTFATLEATPTG